MRAKTLGGVAIFAAAAFALQAWGQASGGQATALSRASANGGPEPYVAEFKVTAVKTMADGSTITQEFTQVRAVDGQGRTMTAITTIPASSDGTPATKVTVFDPAAWTTTSWDSQRSLVTVVKKPLPGSGIGSCSIMAPQFVSAGLATDGQASGKARAVVGPPTGVTAGLGASPNRAQVNTTIENLGTETIEGLTARGTRVTQITSAGAAGNSEPLVNTRETWQTNAHGIALTIREVDDDPKNGKRTMEPLSVSFGEPDPASFRPPQGYEIVTQEVQQVPCQQASHPAQ
jgi:hypothetical protein